MSPRRREVAVFFALCIAATFCLAIISWQAWTRTLVATGHLLSILVATILLACLACGLPRAAAELIGPAMAAIAGSVTYFLASCALDVTCGNVVDGVALSIPLLLLGLTASSARRLHRDAARPHAPRLVSTGLIVATTVVDRALPALLAAQLVAVALDFALSRVRHS